MTIRVLTLSLLLLVYTLPSIAEDTQELDPEELQTQIEDLKTQIERFQELLKNTRDERSNVEDQLRASEQGIGELLQEIDKIQKEVDRRQRKIDALRKEQKELQQAKSEQQGYVVKQIRAAYKIGSQGYVKVLLNQQDPNQLSRILKYYEYFTEARAKKIRGFSRIIANLKVIEAEITEEKQQLSIDRTRLDFEHHALVNVRAERERTLIDLNLIISDRDAELGKRLQDREQLEALLRTISLGVADIPQISEIPFLNRKGKMLLPVQGKVTNRFGSVRKQGKLHLDGVFIATDEGQSVYAVHYGQVVFSDWLRGFGLILIINHGEGYMSLYGHNQVLYREAGDWVYEGELIANSGNTGGLTEPGLYFEIRSAGQPTDPQSWCIARA